MNTFVNRLIIVMIYLLIFIHMWIFCNIRYVVLFFEEIKIHYYYMAR